MNSTVVSALSTLAAAFLGALAAFLLQDCRNRRAEEDQQRAAANRAIFDLSLIWNSLEQFRREIVEPVRHSRAPWLEMGAAISTNFDRVGFDFDQLFFLVEKDKAELLQRLNLEQSRYRITLSLIEERSGLVLNRLQPTMESLGYAADGEIDLRRLEHELGPELTWKLKSLTDSIIGFVDENLASIEQLNDDLTSEIKRLYKGKRVLEVKYPKAA